MLRDYQRKRGKYILPRAVYNGVIWKIRDYYRMKQVAEDLLSIGAINYDSMPKSSGTGDMVSSSAIKREQLVKEIKVIEEALLDLPEEYRSGVWNNILFGSPYPIDADRTTYGRYKSKFIYRVAEKNNLI